MGWRPEDSGAVPLESPGPYQPWRPEMSGAVPMAPPAGRSQQQQQQQQAAPPQPLTPATDEAMSDSDRLFRTLPPIKAPVSMFEKLGALVRPYIRTSHEYPDRLGLPPGVRFGGALPPPPSVAQTQDQIAPSVPEPPTEEPVLPSPPGYQIPTMLRPPEVQEAPPPTGYPTTPYTFGKEPYGQFIPPEYPAAARALPSVFGQAVPIETRPEMLPTISARKPFLQSGGEMPLRTLSTVSDFVDTLLKSGTAKETPLMAPETASVMGRFMQGPAEIVAKALDAATGGDYYTKREGGLRTALEHAAQSLTLEQLASLPVFLIPGVSTAFQAQVLSHLPIQYDRVKQAINDYGWTSPQAMQAFSEAGIEDAMGLLAKEGETMGAFKSAVFGPQRLTGRFMPGGGETGLFMPPGFTPKAPGAGTAIPPVQTVPPPPVAPTATVREPVPENLQPKLPPELITKPPEGGEEDAVKSSDAQMEGGGAALGKQEGAGRTEPETGRGDHVVREEKGAEAGGGVPPAEPKPKEPPVAAKTPKTDEELATGSLYQQLEAIEAKRREFLDRNQLPPTELNDERQRILDLIQKGTTEAGKEETKQSVKEAVKPVADTEVVKGIKEDIQKLEHTIIDLQVADKPVPARHWMNLYALKQKLVEQPGLPVDTRSMKDLLPPDKFAEYENLTTEWGKLDRKIVQAALRHDEPAQVPLVDRQIEIRKRQHEIEAQLPDSNVLDTLVIGTGNSGLQALISHASEGLKVKGIDLKPTIGGGTGQTVLENVAGTSAGAQLGSVRALASRRLALRFGAEIEKAGEIDGKPTFDPATGLWTTHTKGTGPKGEGAKTYVSRNVINAAGVRARGLPFKIIDSDGKALTKSSFDKKTELPVTGTAQDSSGLRIHTDANAIVREANQPVKGAYKARPGAIPKSKPGTSIFIGGSNAGSQGAMIASAERNAGPVHMIFRGAAPDVSDYLRRNFISAVNEGRIVLHPYQQIRSVEVPSAKNGWKKVTTSEGINPAWTKDSPKDVPRFTGKFTKISGDSVGAFMSGSPVNEFLPDNVLRDKKGFTVTNPRTHEALDKSTGGTIKGLYQVGSGESEAVNRVSPSAGSGTEAEAHVMQNVLADEAAGKVHQWTIDRRKNVNRQEYQKRETEPPPVEPTEPTHLTPQQTEARAVQEVYNTHPTERAIAEDRFETMFGHPVPPEPKAPPVEVGEHEPVTPKQPTASQKVAPEGTMSEEEMAQKTRDVFRAYHESGMHQLAPGQPLGRNESVEIGRSAIEAGVDPRVIAKSTQLPEDMKYAVVSAHAEDLKQVAHDAEQLSRKKPTSENKAASDRAFREYSNWQRYTEEAHKRSMAALYPETFFDEPFDPKTFTDLRAQMVKQHGRDFTPGERITADKKIASIAQALNERSKAMDEYGVELRKKNPHLETDITNAEELYDHVAKVLKEHYPCSKA